MVARVERTVPRETLSVPLGRGVVAGADRVVARGERLTAREEQVAERGGKHWACPKTCVTSQARVT